jgi:Flp pilus assembly protein TadG
LHDDSGTVQSFLRPRRRGDRGAVLVESVVALPVLFAMLLGITTGGQAYAAKINMVEAVREGARFGATLQLGTGPTAVSDFEASVNNRVVGAATGTLAAADVCVKLVLPIGATDCGVSDPAGASAQPAVHVVKVSASKPASIQFFFLTTTNTLNAKLAARYERDTG